MKLLGVELQRAELALAAPVGTAQGTHGRRPVLYLRVVTDEAEGWGECGALAGGTAVDPALAPVEDALSGSGVARLFRAAAARHGELPPAPSIRRLFGESALDRSCAATVEMAVLDAELRRAGTPLAERLGGRRRTVETGAVVGIPEGRDLGALVESAERVLHGGARRLRFKIAPGWDLAPARMLRATFPGLALSADANGSYRLGGGDVGAEGLARLDELALVCIEQPLPAADLAALAQLARVLATPIGLDESLGSPRRLAEAIRYRALGVACIKPARMGGLLAGRQALAAAADAGVEAFVGGLFESGLARAANASLGALRGSSLPGDLGDPGSYLMEDPCGYAEVVDGLVQLSGAPGVGAPPSPDALARLAAPPSWFPYHP